MGRDSTAAILDVLQGRGLKHRTKETRKTVLRKFPRRSNIYCEAAGNKWDEVHIAVYDPQQDSSVSDTARRADSIMYDNKRMGRALQT